MTVCKDITKKSEPNTQMKNRILEALFKSNENSRSYYLEEKSKQLFSRCLRLFFFYQKRDVFESLLQHDYGFYRFFPCRNYLDFHNFQKGKTLEENFSYHPTDSTFLKPIFKNITDFLNYDEANQIISACFEYL